MAQNQKKYIKKFTRELFTLLQIGVLIILIRTFIFEPFYIPSGSMESTLEHGDFVFVWKGSYGYSKFSIPFAPINFQSRILKNTPEQGDVAVFRYPKNTKINYIKRIIALPNQSAQIINGRLHVNGKIANRTPIENYVKNGSRLARLQYIETLPSGQSHKIVEAHNDSGPADNTQLYQIPQNHYFAMGDNRDASQDSRFLNQVGYIPEENLIGRAAMIFFSVNPNIPWWQIWNKIRFQRIGTIL